MTGTCATCDLGLDHCHAVVVEHPDGTFECSDGCGGGLAVHDDVVGCAELGFGCCPATVLDDDRRREPLVAAA